MFQKPYQSFIDLLEAVMQKGSHFRVALFCTIAWSLWHRRNRIREKQPSWSLHELGSRAKDFVMEFLNANHQSSQVAAQRVQVKWSPSSKSVYKGNFDGPSLTLLDVQVLEWGSVIFKDKLSLR